MLEVPPGALELYSENTITRNGIHGRRKDLGEMNMFPNSELRNTAYYSIFVCFKHQHGVISRDHFLQRGLPGSYTFPYKYGRESGNRSSPNQQRERCRAARQVAEPAVQST